MLYPIFAKTPIYIDPILLQCLSPPPIFLPAASQRSPLFSTYQTHLKYCVEHCKIANVMAEARNEKIRYSVHLSTTSQVPRLFHHDEGVESSQASSPSGSSTTSSPSAQVYIEKNAALHKKNVALEDQVSEQAKALVELEKTIQELQTQMKKQECDAVTPPPANKRARRAI